MADAPSETILLRRSSSSALQGLRSNLISNHESANYKKRGKEYRRPDPDEFDRALLMRSRLRCHAVITQMRSSSSDKERCKAGTFPTYLHSEILGGNLI
jgi:hypothetical protein